MNRRGTRDVALVVVLAVVVLLGLTPAAGAGPRPGHLPGRVAARLVGDLWRTVLELPADEDNPYVQPRCARVDEVVVPLAPLGPDVPDLSCRIRAGERVLVAARTWEQSAYEQVASGNPDTSLAGLRAEALRLLDQQGAPQVLLDGRPVPLTRAVSRLVEVDLPTTNLFGDPSLTSTRLVATGWIAVVAPGRGRHTITITQPDGTGTTTHLTVLRRSRHPAAARR